MNKASSFVGGWSAFFGCTLGGAAMGGTLVLHHKFNLRQVIQLIEQHKPSVFHSVPAMLSVMNNWCPSP